MGRSRIAPTCAQLTANASTNAATGPASSTAALVRARCATARQIGPVSETASNGLREQRLHAAACVVPAPYDGQTSARAGESRLQIALLGDRQLRHREPERDPEPPLAPVLGRHREKRCRGEHPHGDPTVDREIAAPGRPSRARACQGLAHDALSHDAGIAPAPERCPWAPVCRLPTESLNRSRMAEIRPRCATDESMSRSE